MEQQKFVKHPKFFMALVICTVVVFFFLCGYLLMTVDPDPLLNEAGDFLQGQIQKMESELSPPTTTQQVIPELKLLNQPEYESIDRDHTVKNTTKRHLFKKLNSNDGNENPKKALFFTVLDKYGKAKLKIIVETNNKYNSHLRNISRLENYHVYIYQNSSKAKTDISNATSIFLMHNNTLWIGDSKRNVITEVNLNVSSSHPEILITNEENRSFSIDNYVEDPITSVENQSKIDDDSFSIEHNLGGMRPIREDTNAFSKAPVLHAFENTSIDKNNSDFSTDVTDTMTNDTKDVEEYLSDVVKHILSN